MDKKEARKMKLGEALSVFAIIVCTIGYTALNGIPVGVGLLLSLMFVIAYGIGVLKYTFDDLFDAATGTVSSVFYGLVFCMSVGAVAGAWLSSGTIQFMLYWGLKLINPNMFLIVAFLSCAVAAFLTGQAWTMIPTLGLAYIGIAQAIGIPLPLAAAAIVSGCFLGDAASPMCEVPAVAASSAGTKDYISTIKSMIPSLGIGYFCGGVFFLVKGMTLEVGQGGFEQANMLMDALISGYNLTPLTLVPLVLVFVLIMVKVNPLCSVMLGALAGMIEGVFLQGLTVNEVLTRVWKGFVSATGNEELDALLTRGGLMDFAGTIMMLLVAFCFAGVIKKLGLLDVIIDKLLKFVKTPGAVTVAATLTTLLGVMVVCACNVASVITGTIYKDAYKKVGLHPENLAREMAMNGAVFSAMLPWTSSGALCMTTLGLSTFSYWPYMIPFWIGLVLNIVFAFAGKFNRKYIPEEDKSIG